MIRNVGCVDRIARIGIGVILIGLSVLDQLGIFHSIGYWGYLGIVPLVTGVIRFCPAYCVVKINTAGKCCKTDTSGKGDCGCSS